MMVSTSRLQVHFACKYDSPVSWFDGIGKPNPAYAGFNHLKYDFKLAELGGTVTTVHCTVYCYTHPTGEGQPASPSEKLAIMMRNQDRLAIRQLKGAMKDGHALSVC